MLTQLTTTGDTTVWVVMIEPRTDGPVAVFWTESAASAHAAELSSADPNEAVNIRSAVVQGQRHRCRLCGEPVELDDPSDSMSWIHTPDANDSGDHTAEA